MDLKYQNIDLENIVSNVLIRLNYIISKVNHIRAKFTFLILNIEMLRLFNLS